MGNTKTQHTTKKVSKKKILGKEQRTSHKNTATYSKCR